MSLFTRTYDPGQINITFNSIPLSGFADGSFITVERMSDTFNSVAGAGGEVARWRLRDKRATVKVTLMASSQCNDLLNAIADLDENLGAGIGAFDMSDGHGTTVATSTNAWIKRKPSVDFGKELGTREWEIECESLDFTLGGNR